MKQLPQWKDYFVTIWISDDQDAEGVLLGLDTYDLELNVGSNYDLGEIKTYHFSVRMLAWRRVGEQSVEIEVEILPENGRARQYGLKVGVYKLSFDDRNQSFQVTADMFEEGEISGRVAKEYTPWPED